MPASRSAEAGAPAVALPTGVVRVQGWERGLEAAIEAARLKPYVIGQHDCFRLACAVVAALTGVDLWPGWAGRYGTGRGALRHVALFAQGDGQPTTERSPAAFFTRAACRLFGAQPVPMAQARRGDIAEFRDDKGECHLGVVLGSTVAVLDSAGLVFIPRRWAVHAWRVG